MTYPENGPPLRPDEKLEYVGDNPAPIIVKKTPDEMAQNNVASYNQSGGVTAGTVNVSAPLALEKQQEGIPRWLTILATVGSIVGVMTAIYVAFQ